MDKYDELMKIFRLTILGLVLIFLIPSTGSGSPGVLDEAKKEKEVSIYTTASTNVVNALINSFKEKYPFLKVGLYRAGTQKLITRIMAETSAGKFFADVYYCKGTELNILREKNLLMKYESPESKNYRKDFKDSQGYWTYNYVLYRAIAYNTKLVSPQEAPKSYEDLLDPKWKGKIALPMQRYEWFATMCKAWGEEKAVSYFKKLVAQDLQYHNGLTLNANLLAAGEFSILAMNGSHTIEILKDKGAPVEWFYAKPVAVDTTGPAISAKAPHPNAAKLWVDYLLSKEGQLRMRSFHYVTTRPDVSPDPPRLMADEGSTYDFEDLFKELDYYTKLYKTIFPQ